MSDNTALLGREYLTRATSSGPVTGALARWWAGLRQPRARLGLALQGGGAHGAFTWGVLDALLDDSRLHFEGLSGSKAGAMNTVLLADGPLLERLRALGHERGAAWLARHAASVGRHSTPDVQRHFG